MSNIVTRKLVGGLGTLLVLVICAVLIGGYFITERNLQSIDVSAYVDIKRDGAGGYSYELNLERLLYAEHLINPPASELDRYPEIKALKTLGVRAQIQDGAYSFETISTSSDARFNDTLKKGGLKLINTQWTWTKDQIEAKLNEKHGTMIRLRYPEYIVTKQDADGVYSAELDIMRLMRDANVDPNAEPETDPGLRAMNSLGIACTKNADGWLLQATSVSETVTEDLSNARLQIVNTQWTWTEAEMKAHLGTTETPAATAAPTEEPDGEPTDAPEETAEATPPEEHETPSPSEAPVAETTEKPAPPEHAITTLYGFDQTELRKAIRAAKENYYGSRFENGSVRYNFFAVGSDETEYANVFRLVYSVTTTSGTEYLIADVYNIENETGYTASDVHLKAVSDRSTAKNTDDLKAYSVHRLEGGSMVFPENKDKSPFDKDGLVMAKSISETVRSDELWNIPQTSDLTLLDLLGYARNEMFARGGHQFAETGNYYKHFSRYDWYHPTGTVTATDLAEIYPATSKNISTIKFLEKLIKEG